MQNITKKNVPLIATTIICIVGVLWRYHYIINFHPAVDYVYSDMEGYVMSAINYYDPTYEPDVSDSIYPPGAALFFGFLYQLDPSWQLAMYIQFVLSVGIVILVGSIAYELYGRKVALLAVAITSLYYPFIDYASYFLSENPFTFTMLLSLWMIIRSIKLNNFFLSICVSLATGILLGISASIRSLILLPALFISIYFAFLSFKYKFKKAIPLALFGFIGLFLVIAMLSYRCTILNEGRFCMISTNGALNFAEGVIRDVGHYHFDDQKRELWFEFGSPTSLQHGYNDKIVFSFGFYDKDKLYPFILHSIREKPIDSLLLAIEDVFDVIWGTVTFPTGFTDLKRWVVFYQQIYLLLILLPAVLFVGRKWRSIITFDKRSVNLVLLIMPTIGLFTVAFLFNGELRYRIPFDAFTIILSACLYAGEGIEEKPIL